MTPKIGLSLEDRINHFSHMLNICADKKRHAQEMLARSTTQVNRYRDLLDEALAEQKEKEIK